MDRKRFYQHVDYAAEVDTGFLSKVSYQTCVEQGGQRKMWLSAPSPQNSPSDSYVVYSAFGGKKLDSTQLVRVYSFLVYLLLFFFETNDQQ